MIVTATPIVSRAGVFWGHPEQWISITHHNIAKKGGSMGLGTPRFFPDNLRTAAQQIGKKAAELSNTYDIKTAGMTCRMLRMPLKASYLSGHLHFHTLVSRARLKQAALGTAKSPGISHAARSVAL